ncbi:unnamed protein product [Mesocestoides corti]|uniref:RING-type domain-containing protein n=1 Tax=Mesocestoides corti TaxID=53468 RepID=A0A3P6I2K5_MESCO|nr:unnamed protein product [Mesocestoides corti]
MLDVEDGVFGQRRVFEGDLLRLNWHPKQAKNKSDGVNCFHAGVPLFHHSQWIAVIIEDRNAEQACSPFALVNYTVFATDAAAILFLHNFQSPFNLAAKEDDNFRSKALSLRHRLGQLLRRGANSPVFISLPIDMFTDLPNQLAAASESPLIAVTGAIEFFVESPPDRHSGAVASSSPSAPTDLSSSLLLLLIVFVLFLLLAILFVPARLGICFWQRLCFASVAYSAKTKRSRKLTAATKKALKQLPVKHLNQVDPLLSEGFDQCAICIELFKPNDLIRSLPCSRAGHLGRWGWQGMGAGGHGFTPVGRSEYVRLRHRRLTDSATTVTTTICPANLRLMVLCRFPKALHTVGFKFNCRRLRLPFGEYFSPQKTRVSRAESVSKMQIVANPPVQFWGNKINEHRHMYHRACIDPWLLKHRSCPLCKQNILISCGMSVAEEDMDSCSATTSELNSAFSFSSASNSRRPSSVFSSASRSMEALFCFSLGNSFGHRRRRTDRRQRHLSSSFEETEPSLGRRVLGSASENSSSSISATGAGPNPSEVVGRTLFATAPGAALSPPLAEKVDDEETRRQSNLLCCCIPVEKRGDGGGGSGGGGGGGGQNIGATPFLFPATPHQSAMVFYQLPQAMAFSPMSVVSKASLPSYEQSGQIRFNDLTVVFPNAVAQVRSDHSAEHTFHLPASKSSSPFSPDKFEVSTPNVASHGVSSSIRADPDRRQAKDIYRSALHYVDRLFVIHYLEAVSLVHNIRIFSMNSFSLMVWGVLRQPSKGSASVLPNNGQFLPSQQFFFTWALRHSGRKWEKPSSPSAPLACLRLVAGAVAPSTLLTLAAPHQVPHQPIVNWNQRVVVGSGEALPYPPPDFHRHPTGQPQQLRSGAKTDVVYAVLSASGARMCVDGTTPAPHLHCDASSKTPMFVKTNAPRSSDAFGGYRQGFYSSPPPMDDSRPPPPAYPLATASVEAKLDSVRSLDAMHPLLRAARFIASGLSRSRLFPPTPLKSEFSKRYYDHVKGHHHHHSSHHHHHHNHGVSLNSAKFCSYFPVRPLDKQHRRKTRHHRRHRPYDVDHGSAGGVGSGHELGYASLGKTLILGPDGAIIQQGFESNSLSESSCEENQRRLAECLFEDVEASGHQHIRVRSVRVTVEPQVVQCHIEPGSSGSEKGNPGPGEFDEKPPLASRRRRRRRRPNSLPNTPLISSDDTACSMKPRPSASAPSVFVSPCSTPSSSPLSP